MGLSISVGLLGTPDMRDDARTLHRALEAAGVAWREPAGADASFSAGFPYSFLTGLRRVYALHRLGEPVTPARRVSPEQYEEDLELVDEETYLFDSHLLCHSDCEGYYIPVDLGDPLFLPADSGVPGGAMVGSSQNLLTELHSFAPALGIHPNPDGSLPPAEAARLATLLDDEPFEPELFTWHQLHQACHASVASGRAIVFG
ncbi:hypothetical protein [Kitasatospora viridis]|uniref:Uncharacterized protein n=1 Tax=Kitasatospora viridis TaxID=281105 RepID=A0A561UD42_9ACTN|nr:hypothetical protein [Kitasatospora viridis]TWF97294.1 hypothetical protein FHX73_111074 [Kitasatospora viridis]